VERSFNTNSFFSPNPRLALNVNKPRSWIGDSSSDDFGSPNKFIQRGVSFFPDSRDLATDDIRNSNANSDNIRVEKLSSPSTILI
jgi:hypothetical protein